MAAPHVSGLAVLILSQCTDATYSEIKAQIMDNVDVSPAFAGQCVSNGRINAFSTLSNPVCCEVVSAFNVLNFCQNTSATLNNTSQNATTYIWDFGDGTTSTAIHPSHTYTNAGTYTIHLKATDGICTTISSQDIIVQASPNATFSYSNNDLSLEAYATNNDASSYTWTLDGANIGANATLTYPLSAYGTYELCLNVTTDCGGDDYCETVTIMNPNCEVETWRQYLNGDEIRALLEVGDDIFVGTWGGGLVKINQVSGETTFFNNANSDLPNNYILSLLESSNGEIFVGTSGGGLAKFDGNSTTPWTIYKTNNSDLPSNYVNALLESSNEEIFVGTINGGLAKFDGNSTTGWTIYNTNNSELPHSNIRALLKSSNGEIFVGTYLGGLAKFDGNSTTGWTIYNSNNSDLPSNGVASLLESSNGEILVGTGNSLAKFDGNSTTGWIIYNANNSELPHNYVYSLLESSNGEILVGTWGGGLAKFDGNSTTPWTIYNTNNSELPHNDVFALLKSSNEEIFVGTYNGLAKFDGNSTTGWIIYNTSNSDLPYYNANALLESSNGEIFVGTSGGGLAKFDGNSTTGWTIYNTNNSELPSNYINALLESSNGEIFVGTSGGGLAKFDGNSTTPWTIYNTNNSELPHNDVFALLKSSNEEIFVGTINGLAKFDGNSTTGWNIYNTTNSDLPDNDVLALLESSNGEIFVGTSGGGLAKFDGNSTTPWMIYNTNNSELPHNDVLALLESSSGEIFVGTYDGLAKFDGNSTTGWNIYNTNNSDLPNVYLWDYIGTSVRIITLLESSNGEIFVGTQGGGLAKFDGTSSTDWTIYSTTNSGLSNNRINSLLESSNNEIFIGTRYGLSVLTITPTSTTAAFTTPTYQTCTTEEILFTNTSTNATNYEWFVEGTLVATTTDLTHTFTQAGDYIVELIATNADGCQHNYSELISVVADCVWPGDCDNDGICNYNDFLAIGLAYGASGFSRSDTSIGWSPKFAEDWSTTFDPNFHNGLNHKYADTNGDGTVDMTDTTAVINNYGLIHPATSSGVNSSIPSAFITPTMPNNNVLSGMAITIDLEVGSTINPSGLLAYGLVFEIAYTGTNPHIDFTDSVLGTVDVDMMASYRVDAANQTITAALCRIDQQNVLCAGRVGRLIVIIDEVPAGDPIEDTFSIDAAQIIDNEGIAIPTGGGNINVTVFSADTEATDIPNVVQAQAWLQGAFADTVDIGLLNNDIGMNSHLQNMNLLPMQQPFNTAPWHYQGNEAITPPQTIPNNAVDWVLLEIWDAAATTLIEQKAAFILNNGAIVDVDGISNGVRFYNLSEGESYRILLRARGHLAVMSSATLMLENGAINYDFTTNPTQVLGEQLAELTPNKFGLYCGDIDGNGVINVFDFNMYANQAATINSYSSADCNLDGHVTTSDFNWYYDNASLIGVSQVRY